MVARLLATLLVLVLLSVSALVVVGLLAYGTTPSRTGRVTIASIRAEATVRWQDDQPTITAQSLADTYAALGYVHALESTWAMTLWRQAATGQLATWFGEGGRAYDRHAHTLGLPTQARAAYDALQLDQQRLLVAYAAGVNRALRQPAVAQTDEFVLRDVVPEPWAPWHALAVERLLAYLGTEPPPLVAAPPLPPPDSLMTEEAARRRLAASDDARAFAARDRLFRAALFLGDFSASYAWTAPHAATVEDAASAEDQAARTWMVQQGYGSSALPLVQEVAVERGDRRVVIATVPGTIVTPSALTTSPDGQGGWMVLLTGALALRTTTETLPLRYARIADRNGREALVHAWRSTTLLALTTPPATPLEADTRTLLDEPFANDALALLDDDAGSTQPGPLSGDSLALPGAVPLLSAPDTTSRVRPSVLALRWRGFGSATDTPAWTARLAEALGYPVPETLPAFALLDGDGLRLDATPGGTTWTVLGSPAVRRALPGGVFVGGEPAHSYAASHLADLLTTAPALDPATLATNRYSAWAATAVPSWLGVIGPDLPASFEDAVSYLRGWSYQYAPRAIAPTLLDGWVTRYETLSGRPAPAQLDSAAVIYARLSLIRTADSLEATFGPDPAAWRWENTQPHARSFPIWSSPTDSLIHGPAERRYAPARLGAGHPTTLRGGTSLAFPGQGSAAQWTAWSRSDAPRTTTTIHATVSTRGPLARALDTVNRDRPQTHPPSPLSAPTLRLSPPR
ncbi:MAG: penicillin acylase family protein [Bacteroidota bacterium]